MGHAPLLERVVLGGLVRGRRILLAHRRSSRRWSPSTWDLPGGHADEEETGADALTRELREELGVTPAPALAPDITRLWPQWSLQVWIVHGWSGLALNRAPHEHDALAWVDRALVAEWDRRGRLAGPWVAEAAELALASPRGVSGSW